MDPHWIKPSSHGIYVEPADIWIDPPVPKSHALITHGHADHARGGHGHVWATPETLAIMDLRYGPTPNTPMPYGTHFERGEVTFSFHPAGHVLGSAQILMVYRGERVVVTGDYKRAPDPTCAPFEPVACDIFITEATFGLPVFRHPPITSQIDLLLQKRQENPDRCILIGAYALGKAQRIIAELRRANWDGPVYLHGGLEKMCALYQAWGVELGDLRAVVGTPKPDLAGQIIIAPPSALSGVWSKRLPDPINALASGWMTVRGRARQKNVELPLIISDHADWNSLTETILALKPRETWITHGGEDGLLRWCEMHQIKARALAAVGRHEEDDG